MKEDISMVFCTCDAYKDTWTPFFTLLKKFWPTFNYPVVFNGEGDKCNVEGLSFKYVPNRRGWAWSKRLLKALKYVDTEFVLFMLDDFWLIDYVDTEVFDRCVEIMRRNKRIGFICLYADKKEEMLNNGSGAIRLCEYDGFYEATPSCAYRVTTQVGIWRTKYLKKLIKSYEDAWRFEYWASRRSKFFSYRCLDVKNPVIKYPFGGIIWGGKLKEDYFSLYPTELLKESLEKREVMKTGETYDAIFKNRPFWEKVMSLFPTIRI